MSRLPQIFFILFLIFAINYILSTKNMVLIANDNIYVYKSQEQAMEFNHKERIYKLSPGQTVPITDCIVTKSYMIYKVRLPDKRDGFVIDGKYTVMRDGEESSCR